LIDLKNTDFEQAVRDETARLNGRVFSKSPHAVLTEIKPEGFKIGSIVIANEGLDKSNAPDDCAIGWPEDPLRSIQLLRARLQELSSAQIGVILTDSCCRPRRLGVTAIALTVSGFDPMESQIGKEDLYGHTLNMTHEAVADQFATAANSLMGNTSQSTPAVVIRDHGRKMTGFEGWVDGIEEEEDLFPTP